MSVAAEVLRALATLNETVLTVEQIANMINRMRGGWVPSEDEIDQITQENLDGIDAELDRLDGEE